MPYITNERRDRLDPLIDQLTDKLIEMHREGGDANYVITRIVAGVFKPTGEGWRYHAIEKVRGVLWGVLNEFDRRIAGPYEELCVAKNNDVKEYYKFEEELENKWNEYVRKENEVSDAQ
jgi:hypothetical protein